MDLGPPSIELRPARSEDADLVERILLLASQWRSATPDRTALAVNPAYTQDWGRPDDVGVLAFEGPWFIGGATARRMDPADGTYGFVDADLWEVTIGVEADRRRAGVGRLLLESLKAQTTQRDIAGLSLSVELDNTAARSLYRAANFEVVEVRTTDVLMTWRRGRGSLA